MLVASKFSVILDKMINFGSDFGLKLLGAVAIIVIGFIAVSIITKVMNKAFAKTKLDVSLISFIIKTTNIVLKFLVLLSAISALGISTTGLIAALSAAAVAVSLALKDSLGNVAGGILMLITRPFSTGDFITAGGESGTVLKIDLIHTTIVTPDNRRVVIPNGQIVNMTVTDYSNEELRRVDIDFAISYDNDVEKAKQIILDVVNKHEMSLSEPEPFVRVTNYADSSVTVTTRVWCKAEDFWSLKFDVLEMVRSEFNKEGIVIPYNQLDVHIDSKSDK